MSLGLSLYRCSGPAFNLRINGAASEAQSTELVEIYQALRQTHGNLGSLPIERCHVYFRDDGVLVVDGEVHSGERCESHECGKVVFQNFRLSSIAGAVVISGQAEPITPEFN